MTDELERRFHNDMIRIYVESKKLKYNPTYLWLMLSANGGYMTAKKLIHTESPSNGFVKLLELNRLDLSVEAHVLKPEYEPLFTDEEREICKNRLREYGWRP